MNKKGFNLPLEKVALLIILIAVLIICFLVIKYVGALGQDILNIFK